MEKHTQKQFIEPWQGLAKNWQRFSSPGRPSPTEIKIYEKFLQPALKLKNPRILVLGATPELRDLLAKYQKAAVVLLDNSLNMVLAMTKLLKRKTNNETFVIANWLKAPLKNKSFAAIVGDFIISNVSKRDLSKLLNNIKGWLKPNGYFVSRINVYPTDYQPVTVDELIAKYALPPITREKINYFWEVGNCCTSPMRLDGEVRVKNFWNKLKKYYKNNRYIHPNSSVNKFLKAGHGLYPIDKAWACYSIRETQRILKRFFIIKDFGIEQKDMPMQNIIYQLKK